MQILEYLWKYLPIAFSSLHLLHGELAPVLAHAIFAVDLMICQSESVELPDQLAWLWF
jgi:hypothetical protein